MNMKSFPTQSPRCFNKPPGFKIINRTPNLTNSNTLPIPIPTPPSTRSSPNEFQNFFNNLFVNLNGITQIFSVPLVIYYCFHNSSTSNIRPPINLYSPKSFIITQIQISFTTILSNVNFSMLKRVHSPGIIIEIRIKLGNSNFLDITRSFQKTNN